MADVSHAARTVAKGHSRTRSCHPVGSLSSLNERTSVLARLSKRLIARDRRDDLVVVPRAVRFSRRFYVHEVNVVQESAVFPQLAVSCVKIVDRDLAHMSRGQSGAQWSCHGFAVHVGADIQLSDGRLSSVSSANYRSDIHPMKCSVAAASASQSSQEALRPNDVHVGNLNFSFRLSIKFYRLSC